MSDVEIKFEREALEGLVPVGTYLGDAMRRLGVRDVEPCDVPANVHSCAVEIRSGGELLSPMTAAESEFIGSDKQKSNERLACQARIERPGELVVMTKEKKKEEPET